MRARRPISQRSELNAECRFPISGGDAAIAKRLKHLRACKSRRLVESVHSFPEIEEHREVKECLLRSERQRRASERRVLFQFWHPYEEHVVYFSVLESHRAGNTAHFLEHRALTWSRG